MTVSKDELQKRMLDSVNKGYDKSEGSFFFDAIAPVAIELEKSYGNQGEILNNAFANSAEGEYLDRKCQELGIKRKPATKAVGKVLITGTAGAEAAKGLYVATELVTFAVMESTVVGETGTVEVGVECVDLGTIGNVAANTIKYFPVTAPGLSGVINSESFTNGYNQEKDDSLRERYYDKINTPATSGNVAHYEQWAKSVTGVENVKIFPVWNGPGTVKVVICSSNKRAADEKLLADTALYIAQERPIGADVTVESVVEKTIDIAATIILQGSITKLQVEKDFKLKLEEYFREIALVKNYVSYAKVGNILYDIPGVADYSNLTINGEISNMPLIEVEIPVVGAVVLS